MSRRLPYAGPFRPTTPLDPIVASPGFFRTRFCRDGHLVPARLWKEEIRDEETGELIADVRYFAEVWLEPCDAFDPPFWPWTPCEEPEFRYLVDLLVWSRENRPEAPICTPYLPAHCSPAEYI